MKGGVTVAPVLAPASDDDQASRLAWRSLPQVARTRSVRAPASYETFAQSALACRKQLAFVGSSSKANAVTDPGTVFSSLGSRKVITTSASSFGKVPVWPPTWPPDPIARLPAGQVAVADLKELELAAPLEPTTFCRPLTPGAPWGPVSPRGPWGPGGQLDVLDRPRVLLRLASAPSSPSSGPCRRSRPSWRSAPTGHRGSAQRR